MTRYFVRLPTVALAEEAASSLLHERGPRRVRRLVTSPTVLIAELDEHDRHVLAQQGGRVYADVKFSPLSSRFRWSGSDPVPVQMRSAERVMLERDQPASLSEVLDHVNARQAWPVSRGGGVTIAVVDTGICGTLAEFPLARRSPLDIDSVFAGKHWIDVKGHGSMCAAIAAGSSTAGGRFDGIAPDATILAARTSLFASDIFDIYDQLIAARRQGSLTGPLVISNSYGLYTCDEPAGLPADHPYLEIILTAIQEGAFVVFAAGNNHHDVLCNHDPAADGPNTIWGVNSHDDVFCVGTVNARNSNQDGSTPHANSSRGPGQWADRHPKPDCVAPTYGEVVWGCGYQPMDWWGTSGACPQVAGLAALILSIRPLLRPGEVADIIRESCVPLDAPATCVGSGLIDCAAAVQLALARS